MIGWIWKMLPHDYKFSVAFKKIGIIAGKALTGLIVGSTLGQKLSPQNVEAVGSVLTILTTAGLEAAHDWARLKWPNAKWL